MGNITNGRRANEQRTGEQGSKSRARFTKPIALALAWLVAACGGDPETSPGTGGGSAAGGSAAEGGGPSTSSGSTQGAGGVESSTGVVGTGGSGGAGGAGGAGGGPEPLFCVNPVAGDAQAFDSTFEHAMWPEQAWSAIRGAERDPADRIVVFGEGFGTEGRILVTRFERNGAVDATFGSEGMARIDVGTNFAQSMDLAIDAAGRAYVSGFLEGGPKGEFHGFVARLTPGGSLDASFAGGVIFFESPGRDVQIEAVAPDGDGVYYGRANRQGGAAFEARLGRLTNDGTLDPSLPEVALPKDSVTAVAKAGSSIFAVSGGTLYKLGQDGAVDPSWNLSVELVGANPHLAPRSDGSVAMLAGGTVQLFGADGTSAFDFFCSGCGLRGFASTCDGRILAAGLSAEAEPSVVRVLPSGQFDLGAASAPLLWPSVTTVLPGGDAGLLLPRGAVVQSDGRVVLVVERNKIIGLVRVVPPQ